MSSAANLSMDGEFRYIVQWFNEWSELQREDFLPILVEYLTKDTPGAYVNGIVSGLAGAGCADKPMSLFQCRVSAGSLSSKICSYSGSSKRSSRL